MSKSSTNQKETTSYRYKLPKKIMRLCAIGMVADGNIDNKEKVCITNIIVREILHNKKQKGGRIEDELKYLQTLTSSFDIAKVTPTSANTDYSYSGDSEVSKFDIHINKESKEYEWLHCSYEDNNNKGNKEDSQGSESESDKDSDQPKIDLLDQCFIWARYYVEFIAKQLKGSANAQQGLFVDIGSYKIDDIKHELYDIILVILGDNSVLENERVAFMAIARIFRVRKVATLWDKLIEVDKEELFNEKYSCIIKQKQIIDADDVLMIEKAICNYKIQGALKEGLKNAIIAEKERYVKETDHLYNCIFKCAVLGFILSATFIYLNISFLVEDKIIIRECLDKESPIENIYYNSAIDVLTELRDSLDINTLDSLFYPNSSVIMALTSPNVKDCAEYDKDTIVKAKKDITKWWVRNNTLIGGHKCLIELYVCFIGLFLWILFPFIRRINLRMKEKIFRNSESLHSFFMCCLGAVVSCFAYLKIDVITLSILHNPFLILILMICIELMIFLREINVEKLGNKKKKDSTGLLVVIVVIAIVADICISFIELPVKWDSGMLADKLAAALLLGCLCFFIGKFLDMYSMRKRIDISNMEASIERTVAKLNSLPEK